MSEYTDEFDKLLHQIIQEYFRNKYKAINYTDTYTRKSLLAFSQALIDRAMYNH